MVSNEKIAPHTIERYVWAFLRVGMGWIFIWAFFDKAIGLGFNTEPSKAWLAGSSPTYGFLAFGSSGPFVPFYQSIAGSVMTDVLFMAGLLLIGTALILGIGVRIAGSGGAAMMLLMWSAVLPPAYNPILDEHITYVVVLVGIIVARAGRTLGIGQWWADKLIVKKFPFLE